MTFKRGQRVKLTREAEKQGLRGRKNRTGCGTVVRETRDRQFVIVKQDGCLSANGYYPGFWRTIQ